MFKICSIGCGNMARTGHGPTFKKYAETYPDTCLAAMLRYSPRKRRLYKKKKN